MNSWRGIPTSPRPFTRATNWAARCPLFRLSPEAERRLLDDARSRARNKLMVIGVGIGLIAIVILTALGGALMLGLRTFGEG